MIIWSFPFFPFNRKDSISEIADEVIGEINASDEKLKYHQYENLK